jgi:hypothetical protein
MKCDCLGKHHRDRIQQLARGQVADQGTVGGQELVAGKVFEPDPADLVIDAVSISPAELMHGKELQIDGAAMAIVVADAGDAGADGRANAEFFVQFAGQRLLRAFAGSILPPGNSHSSAMG